MAKLNFSKIGNAARLGANATAESNWNSGDANKQNVAIATWTTLASSGDLKAIESLQQLINQGVQKASGALLIGLTAQAKTAALKKDSGIAEGLVALHNSGWSEATNAIRVVLPKKRAAKGSKKHIEVVKLFAEAGFPPAIEFFNGNEEALDFEEIERAWMNDGSTSTKISSLPVSAEENLMPPVSDLPSRLQTIKTVLENSGFICDVDVDITSGKPLLITSVSSENDETVPVFIFSTGSCLNMFAIVCTIDDNEQQSLFELACDTVNENADALDSIVVCNIAGEDVVAVVRQLHVENPIDASGFIAAFKEFIISAVYFEGWLNELLESILNSN